jgi:hypothetical protein
MALPSGSLAIAVEAVSDALAVTGVSPLWLTGAVVDVHYWDDGVAFVYTALELMPVTRRCEGYT